MVPDLALDTLRRTFEVNMFGVAESIEAVLPGMLNRGRGHIVGVASLAGYRGFPWMISYSASKAALIAYLEALRPGLARRGITVTTVMPRLRPHRDEHRSSLQAKGQDDRAGTGRSTPCAGHPPAPAELCLPLVHADGPGHPQAHAGSPVRLVDARAGPEALAVDF